RPYPRRPGRGSRGSDPTAAAEIVVPNKRDLLRQLGERAQRLQRAGLTALIAPSHQLQRRQQSLERLTVDLTTRRRERLGHLEGMMRQRDPREVLRQRERALDECRRTLARRRPLIGLRFEADLLGYDSCL